MGRGTIQEERRGPAVDGDESGRKNGQDACGKSSV